MGRLEERRHGRILQQDEADYKDREVLLFLQSASEWGNLPWRLLALGSEKFLPPVLEVVM